MTNIVSFPGLGLEFELNRVAFSVFGHNIYWYGVIIAAGFLLAVIYCLRRSPEFSTDPDALIDAVFVTVPLAIVGARLYYVVFNPSVCFDENGSFSLLRAVALWNGGLAIYGGVIATVVTVLIFCKVRKVNFWSIMDVTAYGLLIGQMIGRWGNFVNVEAYGSVTTLPWRMCSVSIANGLWRNELITTQEAYQSVLDGTLGVHPTFLYEALWNLLGFLLLVLLAKKGRKFNGQMFLSYVIWYGLGRAAIEGLRTDSLYFFSTGIRTSQMVGMLSAVVGIALFVYRMIAARPADPPLVKEDGKWKLPQPETEAPTEEQSEPVAAAVEDTLEERSEATAVEVPTAEKTEEEKSDGGDNP